MTKKFAEKISLFLFVFFCFIVNKGSGTITIADSIPTVNKPWKISQQQFLDIYGKDDTSRAIINYYFRKHDRGSKRIFLNTALTGIGITLFFTIAANSAPYETVIVEGIIFLGALFVGLNAFTKCINIIYYSRKKLYKELKNYSSGKKIPATLRREIYSKKNLLKTIS